MVASLTVGGHVERRISATPSHEKDAGSAAHVIATSRSIVLGSFARAQHGAFTRRQAVLSGFTRNEVDGKVRRREWIAIDHGVYRAAETPVSWRQRVMAACLAGPAVASHRSAAALWGFPDFVFELVEVTSLRHRRRKSPEVVWHESVRLDQRETTEIDGIPTTGATRTIIDLGSVLHFDDLLKAIDDALRRNLTSTSRISNQLEQWGPQRRGIGTVRRAVALRNGLPVPESVLESEFDALIRRYGLPQPSRQWVIRDDHGDAIARVDFAYPVARIAIEIDGLRWHGALPDRERDDRRQNAIVSLRWTVLRFTARDIRGRPEWIRATILTALAHPPASLDRLHDGERRNQ